MSVKTASKTEDPTFAQRLKVYQERVDNALLTLLPPASETGTQLPAAMRYAVTNGGKRVRPVLAYATGIALGIPLNRVDVPACALEMMHAYSLVHDDLPAMDDDDLRRGKPTCHKAFDEATAILAGDALQALAFTVLAINPDTGVSDTAKLQMVKILGDASGANGMAAGQAIDLEAEPLKTRELYGLDNPKTDEFGRKCLMARRLVERGVRFIQLYSGGAHNDDNWDAHGDLETNHNKHAGGTDKPIAALLTDLKRRGLLDETLVVWGGEFGRQPTAEYAKGTGRDHNAYGFTMWMAGGGIRGGTSFGQTDEFGSVAVENRFHVKHLHATILNQLGLNPNRLSFLFGGLDQKLVGVEHAEPIEQIIS